MFADSQALGGNETIDVQATPSGVTTTTDTGSTANSHTNVGLNGLISSISGPVVVQSTGGANTLTVNDSAKPAAATYTIASDKITASSLPSSITLGGVGIATLNLESSGGSTVNLPQIVQAGVTTYNFSGGTGLGANTLNTTSPITRPDYTTTPGVVTFGAGNPTIDYTNFANVNITKPAIPPTGAGVNISFTPGQALTNVTVATFTLDPADLSNISTNFTASINWGDGTAATAGTITANGGGSFNILGTHTYATAGPFIINVTLTDQQTVGSATVAATTVTITANGPVNSSPDPIVSAANSSSSAGLSAQGATVTGTEGAASLDNPTANGALLATFTDSTPGVPGDYTASIDWGDGSSVGTGIITSQGTGNGTVFSVYGNHTYSEEGTYSVTVTITKTATDAVAIALGQAVIRDAALTATTATALTATTGQAMPATSIIGSFTDANTGAHHHRLQRDDRLGRRLADHHRLDRRRHDRRQLQCRGHAHLRQAQWHHTLHADHRGPRRRWLGRHPAAHDGYGLDYRDRRRGDRLDQELHGCGGNQHRNVRPGNIHRPEHPGNGCQRDRISRCRRMG